MSRAKDFIWLGVGLVALAYVLMAFVKAFLPVLVVIAAICVGYSVMTKRRW